jgi:hypothetical protein
MTHCGEIYHNQIPSQLNSCSGQLTEGHGSVSRIELLFSQFAKTVLECVSRLNEAS